MDLGLKQFVPSETCLACEGCCRFSEGKSSWRPRLTEEEKDVPVLEEHRDGQGCLKTKEQDGGFFCSCFDAERNACTVYADRPFDCALYPFLLVRLGDGPAVAAHLNCPFVQDTWDGPVFERHTEYLKEFFARPRVLNLVRDNPSLFTDVSACPQEIEKLFSLKL